MIDSSLERDPVELLADEFATRCRSGERPAVAEYIERYPEYAERIGKVFPAVLLMEELRVAEKCRREASARRARPLTVPPRLGDFEIIQEIGRGGMGVVFEAEQRSLARRVAVKVLPQHVLRSEQHLQRFQREAQTAARLQHTGIVPVFGVGEQDDLHYYVMPLVRGVGLDDVVRELRAARDTPPGSPRDIRDVVRALTARKFPVTGSASSVVFRSAKERPFAERKATIGRSHSRVTTNWCITTAWLGVQAAEALAYAHVQGTLHRDIKPSNLLVDENGNACLADFGLARAIEPADSGRAAEVVGTPRYMAPEQLQGRADARTDIYSLGLTIYELLTLRPALGTRGASGRPGERDGRPRPVRPRQIDREIPRDLEAIVLKCLEPDPPRRYQTASALAADLRRFLDDKPIRARRASRIERAWRWCRRNRALAALSCLAVLLVVALLSAAAVGHLRTRTAYTEARQALARADATSDVALEVLERLYLQLSPERVWIGSDSDAAGLACACVGLRSARPPTSDQLDYIQVQTSEQTAALLQNLLVFYDRLAEQAGDNDVVLFESAIAARRVGDIRQRLGQMDQAAKEYGKAAERFAAFRDRAPADNRVDVELARVFNELGNVRSAHLNPQAAARAHHDALHVLQSAPLAGQPLEEYRYELARTYFFLSRRCVGDSAGQPGERVRRSPERLDGSPFPAKEYRKLAVRLLQQLTRENPQAADYRFLLALCYRPQGIEPEPSRGSANQPNRKRSLRILEALKAEYPQVADYRFELAVTYAWVHVGLFPWQGRSASLATAEPDLRKALDEIVWLIEHNPTIPHYARCKALVLAKLAAVCSETDRPVEAADLFDQAVQTQAALVDGFPDLPPHDRVLLEFFRLRLAAAEHGRGEVSPGQDQPARTRELLETCVRNLKPLAGEHDLADDRLASTSLQVAEEALARMRQE